MFRKIFFILIFCISVLISISFSGELQFNGSLDMRFNYNTSIYSGHWRIRSTSIYLNRVEFDLNKSLEYQDKKIDIFVQMLPVGRDIYYRYIGDAYFIVRNPKSKKGIKYGKFDVPFGLSTQVDVYNTIIHPNNQQNIDIQKDVGIEIFGENKFLGYNFSLTDGDDIYYKLFTSRIRKNFPNNLNLGLSNTINVLLASSDSYHPKIKNYFYGIDLMYRNKNFTFKSESVKGHYKFYDERTNVYYSELDYNINKKSEFVIGYNLKRSRQLESENACRGECKFRGSYITSKSEFFSLGYNYNHSENYITRTAIEFTEPFENTKYLNINAQTYVKF